MRKQTKLAAVVSAAALVALGASMTSMAAGWVQENGLWYYENTNGDYVYDEWKRSGDNYFYLGWDGYMLTNQLVQHGDNYYYVDANGAMVKNQWVAVAADDTEDQDVDHRWYYFGSTGRAYRSSGGFAKKTINGQKYAFDEEGKMLYGWIDDGGTEYNNEDNAPLYSTYFFGPNDTTTINGVTYTGGAMVTGWYNYLDGLDTYEDEGDDSLWFYFNTSTGKKTAETQKRIGGLYYHFDVNGVMDSGWTAVGSESNAASGSTYYYSGSDQGWKQRNAWVWAVPTAEQDPEDNADDQYRWFYVNSAGAPVTGTKRINSKWYVFNEYGIMKSGLVYLSDEKIATGLTIVDTISAEDTSSDDIKGREGNLFYFSNDEEHDGSMKTGNSIKIDLSDGTFTFGFAKSGKALHGEQSKKVYDHGILLDGGDMRYSVATVNSKSYVVGPTGTYASNNTTVKDADDNYYAVVGGYIFEVPAGDYAARVARAIVAIGQGKLTGVYDRETGKAATAETPVANYAIKIDSETYEDIAATERWDSSYNEKVEWKGTMTADEICK